MEVVPGNNKTEFDTDMRILDKGQEHSNDARQETKERVNLLMTLFRRSGVAKIQGVLRHLETFR